MNYSLKVIGKNLIGSFFSPLKTAVLINSYGRSGSTLLCDAVVNAVMPKQSLYKNKWIYRSIKRNAWDLNSDNLKIGFIYKTHDYPPFSFISQNTKIFYIFADPVDVVLSLIRLYNEKGKIWMYQHYEHLNAVYTNFDEIIYEDQLGLENHFDEWLKEERCPVLFVRYESLWSQQVHLSKFLGVPLKLPEYRHRKCLGEINSKIVKKVEETYGRFRDRVFSLDGCFTNDKGRPFLKSRS